MQEVKAWAPGRVNIIGEHTDYTGGYVFPMAIELGVLATITTRQDRQLKIESNLMAKPVSIEMDQLSPDLDKDWSSYAAGGVWSVMRNHKIPFGLDISLSSNLPVGAGMSSSAAVECSVILALVHLLDLNYNRRQIAQLAKDAENLYVGVPTGSMDQVASMFGEAGKALFFDTRDDQIVPISIDLTNQDAVFAVIDTKSRHALIDGGYAARRTDCEVGSELLGVDFLRDVENLNTALHELTVKQASDQVVRRVRHVVSENSRVLAAVEALQNNDLIELGKLMNQSHDSLRDDFEVSCPELNVAVDSAQSIGAYGARMMGGGFGGSAIALLPRQLLPKLTEEVSAQFTAHGFTAPMVYQVTASQGAHVVQD